MMTLLRLPIWLLIFTLWFWANSIFAPWAASADPRLWLYDVLFYTRFVLMFWAAFELLYACYQIRNTSGQKKSAVITMFAIGTAALTVSAYLYLMHTGNGFRARVGMSSAALSALQKPDFANVRQRAGWFLVDTQRQPCGDEPWLWLGNMYGGGTGNNLALVHTKNDVPKTPMAEAFRFWPVSGGWWLAYQNPTSYYSGSLKSEACRTGKQVSTHDQGMKFITTVLQDDSTGSGE